MLKQLKLLLVILVLQGTAVNAEILMSSPPLSKGIAVNNFDPLLEAMGEAVGDKVTYVPQDNWLEYSKNLRLDIYDVIISEAHIAAWLQLTGGQGGADHELLAGVKGQHQVVLVTLEESDRFKRTKDFVNQRVCVKPSPSIDSVRFYELYPNPIYQPFVYEVNGSYEEILSTLKKGRCKGAVINQALLDTSAGLKPIQEFGGIPNVAITASPRLIKDTRSAIKQFLLNPENATSIELAMKAFVAEGKPEMTDANRDDYRDNDRLLQNVWGW